jgi:hypothetical protein
LPDTNDSELIRTAAVEALGNIRGNEHPGYVAELLKHKDPFIRAKAAEVLGNSGEGFVEPLIAALANGHQGAQMGKLETESDRRGMVLCKIIEALGNTGSPRAVDALFSLLRVDKVTYCPADSVAIPTTELRVGTLPLARALSKLVIAQTAPNFLSRLEGIKNDRARLSAADCTSHTFYALESIQVNGNRTFAALVPITYIRGVIRPVKRLQMAASRALQAGRRVK